MSQKEKLLRRILSVPSDLTWDEITKFLTTLGYSRLSQGKTGGSRTKFCNAKGDIINLHKPHPGSIVKKYVIRQVIEHLVKKGEIKDE